MKQIGPMKVYPLLPKTNCGVCEPKTCMGFAVQLCERNNTLDECPPLLEPKHRENLVRLRKMCRQHRYRSKFDPHEDQNWVRMVADPIGPSASIYPVSV
jgi:CO dehydrogenase/acetyl-CoA synthase gamma subunit (corrinoid Fe-S protein)